MSASREPKKSDESKSVLLSKTVKAHSDDDLICPLTKDHIARCKSSRLNKYSSTIDIININTGKIEKQLKEDQEGFTGLVWDGKNIITSAPNGKLKRWDIVTGESEIIPFKDSTPQSISQLHLVSDQQLIYVDENNQINLLDLNTGTTSALFKINKYIYNDILIKNNHLICQELLPAKSGELISKIHVYDLSSRVMKEIVLDSSIRCFAASDDTIAVMGPYTPVVDFYDFQGNKLKSLSIEKRLAKICALPTGQFCVFTFENTKPCVCYLIDPRSDKQQHKNMSIWTISSVQFNPANGHLIGISNTNGKYSIFDLDIGLKEKYEKELKSSDLNKTIHQPSLVGIILSKLGLHSDTKLEFSKKEDSGTSPSEEESKKPTPKA